MIELEADGEVRILRWNDGENRLNLDSVARWNELLDELAGIDGPLAVVVVGSGKFFSNGLDLNRFMANPDETAPTLDAVHRLFGRLLTFPAYTVAALGGHAFAAGAMLACCLDTRVMRADRGYWCLPEVDLGLPLTEPMTAAVTARLPRTTAHDAMMTGRRYDAAAALAAGIVEATAAEDDVLPTAVTTAALYAAKNRHVIADHKRQLYGAAAARCGWDVDA